MSCLLEALAVETVSQLMDTKSRQKFIPQNLANLVYGYAVLGADPGPMLLIAIAKESQRQLHDFGPQVCPVVQGGAWQSIYYRLS